MAKTNIILKMPGVLQSGAIAKTHQAKDVVGFKYMGMSVVLRFGKAYLKTPKGSYILDKSVTGEPNKYVGKCNDIIVHFTHKKITAKLIYWS